MAQQPRRSAQDDPEYRQNYVSFEYVNALYALDNGWTGAGVNVAVLDDGVKEVSELTGKISNLSRDYGTVTQNGVTRQRNVIGDDDSDHGTMVASVIAAANDGSGIQGIAPGANIVALRISEIDLDATDPDDRETLGIGLTQAIGYAGSQGIKVINASIAKTEPDRPSAAWAQAVAGYQRTGGLFVNAAGNDSGANADGYLDLNASNSASWLFVVSLAGTQTGYELAGYSNQCGTVAMNNCVAAMGRNAAQDVDGSLVWFSGTSSATPQVSGLAALILSKWPQLSGIQAGQVIVNTARDIGAPGVDPVFGHGLIDVRAALSPVNPTLSNGVQQTSAESAMMIVPAPVNAKALTAGTFDDVAVLDAYGRDFSGDLSGLVVTPGADRHWLERRVAVQARAGGTSFATRDLQLSASFTQLQIGPGTADMRTALTQGNVAVRAGKAWLTAGLNSSDAVADGFLGLAPTPDVTLAYSPLAEMTMGVRYPLAGGTVGYDVITGRSGTSSAGGMLGSWRKGGTVVKAGMLTERNAVFGAPTGSGALRFGDGARTMFIEAAHGFSAGAWNLAGYASLGATDVDLAHDMLLTRASRLVTYRLGVTASRSMMGGRFTLGLAQPLTVVSGKGTYTVASGYDLATRSLRFSDRDVDFAGRFDPLMTFGYERGIGNNGWRVAAATNASGTDLRALGTWRILLK